MRTPLGRRLCVVCICWGAWALLLAPSAALAQFSGWWTVVPPPAWGGPYPSLIGPGWLGPLPPQPLGHRITRFLDGGYAYEPIYEPSTSDDELLADDFATEAAERFTAIAEDWLPPQPQLEPAVDDGAPAQRALVAAGAALRAGRTEEARGWAEQAAQTAAVRPLANLFLAQACLEERDWARAAQHLTAGLASLDPARWRNIAQELARWSGPQAVPARQALRDAVRANPQDGDPLFLLGAWHAWHGSPAEAQALLAAAIAAGRDDLCVLRLHEQCRRATAAERAPAPPLERGQDL